MFKKGKMNNRGSSLIIVIIVMTFIGVLATVVLSMTSINAQTKTVDANAKKTFYDAESALDEVTLGIENVLAESTNKAYSSIFTEFTTLSNDERNTRFQDEIVNGVKEKLKFSEVVKDAYGKQPIVYLLQSFITNSSAEVVSVGSCTNLTIGKEKYLKISGVKIVYNDGDYSNTITTDIRINVPVADLSANIPSTTTLSFEKYGLICENQLLVDNRKLTVNGDIYAGYNGININGSNSSVAFVSDNIISKGDILVSNTYLNTSTADKVTLATASTSKSRRTNIWAKNIIIKNTDSAVTLETLTSNKKNTDISLANASVKIKDDLELYSPSSRVIISGEYFGFGYDEFNEPESSSIIINGRNSYLDIRGLSSLQLAGRSFIKVPSKVTDGVQEYDNIAMGESLTIRGNQIAYLVPSACISLKHNPITWDEYKNNTPTIDITAVDVEGEFTLADYLVTGDEYKASIYQKASGAYVVYYYLNIKTDKLTQFYTDYCKTFGTSRMADIFKVAGLKTNTVTQADGTVVESGDISAVGNVVSEYIIGDVINDMSVLDPGAAGVSVTAHSLSNTYRYWTSYLRTEEDTDMTDAGYSINKGVCENMINVDLINEIRSVTGGSQYIMDIKDTDGSEYSILIVDNYGGATLEIPANMKGIVIATGNVNLDFEGGNFTGLIIAGCKEMNSAGTVSNGVITVSSTSTVIASEKVVKGILGDPNVFSLTYEKDGVEKTVKVADFFREPSASSVVYVPEVEEEEEQFQSLAGMVVYENWTKE